MEHVVEIKLRLHIDEIEIRSGETPLDAAERILEDGIAISGLSFPERCDIHELDRYVGLTD